MSAHCHRRSLIYQPNIFIAYQNMHIYLWVFALQCRKQELTTFSDFDSSWESVLHVHTDPNHHINRMFSFRILFSPCHFNAHCTLQNWREFCNTEIMMQINWIERIKKHTHSENNTLVALVDFTLRPICISLSPFFFHFLSISLAINCNFSHQFNRFFLTISTSNCNGVLIHTMS